MAAACRRPRSIPVARLREGADRAWADGAETLLYGEVRGYRPLRELIVERMAARGAIVDPADVLITNGAQQGIDLAARIFVDPGDIVLTEEPTFMDALRVFRSHEAEPVGVPVDEEGLQVDVLAAMLDRLPKRPKFLYTMPTYQNPMGVSMSTRDGGARWSIWRGSGDWSSSRTTPTGSFRTTGIRRRP